MKEPLPLDSVEEPEPSTDRLAAVAALRVCVVGDVMLDRWITGTVDRLSPEAPVPVVSEVGSDEALGGAANVARACAALGAETRLAGLLGDDPEAVLVRRLCAATGVAAHLVADRERPTTTKTRIGDGHHHVVRLDRESRDRVTGEAALALVGAVRAAVPGADVVIVSDYAKGVVTPEVFAALCDAAGTRPILVDPKAPNPAVYHGARWISPNRSEAERWAGRHLSGDGDYADVCRRILQATGAHAIFLTLGAEGIYVASAADPGVRVPAQARAVYDVTGAGDTCAAVLALTLAAGATVREAAEIANAAGGVAVGMPGTAVVRPAEIRRALAGGRGVLLDREGLVRALADERARGRRIVFTNGCFDLLHPGHLALLARCRAEGDVVVVAVNDDASVRRLKGEGRPVMRDADRAAMLAGLADVDYVTVFAEDTPADLVAALRPDVLVKGSDWAERGVVGRELVEQAGGRVVLVPRVPGFASSGLRAIAEERT